MSGNEIKTLGHDNQSYYRENSGNMTAHDTSETEADSGKGSSETSEDNQEDNEILLESEITISYPPKLAQQTNFPTRKITIRRYSIKRSRKRSRWTPIFYWNASTLEGPLKGKKWRPRF